MEHWFHDGQPISAIPITDRGFQYSDGLFETIAIRAGELRLFALHMDRLRTGCRRLAINVCEREELTRLACHAIEQSELVEGDGLLKLIITRGDGKRGYHPPANHQARIYAGIFPASCSPDSHYVDGIKVRICNTRLASQPQTAGMKTLGRLDQVLARAEWQDPSIVEGLMLDQDGDICCGTMSNLFLVERGILKTPELTRCGVSGVMRRHLLQLAEDHHLSYEIGRISIDMLKSADEVFVCNSQSAIRPVVACGKNRYERGPVTSQLMLYLRDSGVVEGPR